MRESIKNWLGEGGRVGVWSQDKKKFQFLITPCYFSLIIGVAVESFWVEIKSLGFLFENLTYFMEICEKYFLFLVIFAHFPCISFQCISHAFISLLTSARNWSCSNIAIFYTIRTELIYKHFRPLSPKINNFTVQYVLKMGVSFCQNHSFLTETFLLSPILSPINEIKSYILYFWIKKKKKKKFAGAMLSLYEFIKKHFLVISY